jgi:hypothetical protein
MRPLSIVFDCTLIQRIQTVCPFTTVIRFTARAMLRSRSAREYCLSQTYPPPHQVRALVSLTCLTGPLSSLLVIQRGIERLVALQEPANGPCPALSSAVSHGVRLMSILLSRH